MIKILPLPIKANDKKYLRAYLANYYNIITEIFTAHDARDTADTVTEVEALGEIITFSVTHLYRNIKARTEVGALAVEHDEFYHYVADRLLDARAFDNDIYDARSAHHFEEIIALCAARLESLGYDEEKRQELYQAINEKNYRRGYLEDKK